MSTPAILEEIFSGAGVQPHFHALDLGSGRDISVNAETPAVAASVFKLPVLVELYAQADRGLLDLTAPVEVPAEGRAPGPFGLSIMQDAARLSLRDLSWLMMGI